MKTQDKSLSVFTISSALIFTVTMTATIGILWFAFQSQHQAFQKISSGVELEALVTALQCNFLFLGGTSGFILLTLSLFIGRVLSQRYQAICRLKDREQRLALTKHELEKSLTDIKVLEGLLPVCVACKKIRDDKGYWNQIDHYLKEHNDAQISHNICPECSKNIYIDFYNDTDDGKSS